MKVIITESQYNRVIDQFITHLLEPHEERTSKVLADSIFWVKSGEVIVEIEDSKDFYLEYGIWNTISKIFDLNRDQTQSVINIWLDKHYGFGELIPKRGPMFLADNWVSIIDLDD